MYVFLERFINGELIIQGISNNRKYLLFESVFRCVFLGIQPRNNNLVLYFCSFLNEVAYIMSYVRFFERFINGEVV